MFCSSVMAKTASKQLLRRGMWSESAKMRWMFGERFMQGVISFNMPLDMSRPTMFFAVFCIFGRSNPVPQPRSRIELCSSSSRFSTAALILRFCSSV